MNEWMNEYSAPVELYWQGKTEYMEKDASECHFLYHKSRTIGGCGQQMRFVHRGISFVNFQPRMVTPCKTKEAITAFQVVIWLIQMHKSETHLC
jgi:hypothetical protein